MRLPWALSTAHHPGRRCGFPVVKLVAVFCLHTGALIRWVQDTLHEHENRLFKGLLGFFSSKDIVVAAVVSAVLRRLQP